MAPLASEQQKMKLKEELEGDNRDVADLWNEALKSYKGIVGFDLKPQFANVNAMIEFGGNEMAHFHKFRHNEKKVDKLRTLLGKNLDYLEKGAQQLVSAATPAFPPAAAIGTAITYMIKVTAVSTPATYRNLVVPQAVTRLALTAHFFPRLAALSLPTMI